MVLIVRALSSAAMAAVGVIAVLQLLTVANDAGQPPFCFGSPSYVRRLGVVRRRQKNFPGGSSGMLPAVEAAGTDYLTPDVHVPAPDGQLALAVTEDNVWYYSTQLTTPQGPRIIRLTWSAGVKTETVVVGRNSAQGISPIAETDGVSTASEINPVTAMLVVLGTAKGRRRQPLGILMLAKSTTVPALRYHDFALNTLRTVAGANAGASELSTGAGTSIKFDSFSSSRIIHGFDLSQVFVGQVSVSEVWFQIPVPSRVLLGCSRRVSSMACALNRLRSHQLTAIKIRPDRKCKHARNRHVVWSFGAEVTVSPKWCSSRSSLRPTATFAK